MPTMPSIAVILTTWRLDPLALVALLVAAALYGVGIRSAARRGVRWPLWPAVRFYALGLGSYAWLCFGFLGAYSEELRWAFTTRLALLLFAVPYLLSLGKPVALAQAALSGAARTALDRFLASRFMAVVGNAVFETLFSLAVFLVFLTPFSGPLRTDQVSEALITILVPLFGLLMVVPIMEDTKRYSGFFITFEFMLSFAALVFDAVPGILLRLNDIVFDKVGPIVAHVPPWFPSRLRDQQLSGDLLWFLAETADIPVLIVLIVRWSRIDRREARAIDDLSDEEMEALTQAHLHRR